jgi:hypothetical protein
MRTTLALLYRSFLFMLFGAGMVVLAQKYGAALFAEALPEAIRPTKEEVQEMRPQKIFDALGAIRGALE